MSHTTTSTARFSDRVARLLERTEYRCAVTTAEKEAIFRLRYDSYRREGEIEANDQKSFADSYDTVANVWIVGMYVDGELASSIRLHVAGDIDAALPAASVFPEEVKPHLDRGRIFVDPTRHVTNFAFSKRFPEMPFLTVRSAWMAGEFFGADYVLAAVRVEHLNFYKRVFGHVEWSEPRSYPKLRKPIVCMAMDFPAGKRAVEAKYPFYVSGPAERQALFASSSNPRQRGAEASAKSLETLAAS